MSSNARCVSSGVIQNDVVTFLGCRIATNMTHSATDTMATNLNMAALGCGEAPHQEVKNVGPGDGCGNVVSLQCPPLVLLRVRPRAVRQLQDEHLARLRVGAGFSALGSDGCLLQVPALRASRVQARTLANRTGASALIIRTSSSDFMICSTGTCTGQMFPPTTASVDLRTTN